MKPKVTKLEGFTEKERVRFLKQFARELRRDDLNQVAVVLLRRDNSVCIKILDDRRTSHEVIGMLERAKLETWEDHIEARHQREG